MYMEGENGGPNSDCCTLADWGLNINKHTWPSSSASPVEANSSSATNTSMARARHAAGPLHFNVFVGFPKYAPGGRVSL